MFEFIKGMLTSTKQKAKYEKDLKEREAMMRSRLWNVPMASGGRGAAASSPTPYIDPAQDMMSPLNPLSPFYFGNSSHTATTTPTPQTPATHHFVSTPSPAPSYECPAPSHHSSPAHHYSPSPIYDSPACSPPPPYDSSPSPSSDSGSSYSSSSDGGGW